jgi:hypothetical protein
LELLWNLSSEKEAISSRNSNTEAIIEQEYRDAERDVEQQFEREEFDIDSRFRDARKRIDEALEGTIDTGNELTRGLKALLADLENIPHLAHIEEEGRRVRHSATIH